MKKQFVLFVAVFFFSILSIADVKLENVRASIDDELNEFVVELNFNESIDLTTIKIGHSAQSMSIDIPKANIESKDTKLKLGDKDVSSINVKSLKKSVNLKVNFNEFVNGESFREYTRMEKDGKSVRIKFKRHSYILARTKKLKKPKTPLIFTDTSSKDLEKVEISKKVIKPKSIKKVKHSETKEPLISVSPSVEKSEENIPVFSKDNSKTISESSSNLSTRLIGSLAVIFLFGFGAFIFVRWWSKRNKVNEITNKIRVLTQHHLGPKKSLAIIRVAGESILVGITEGSINHIKTLSLIDDEIPANKQSVPFKSHLEGDFYSDELEKSSVNDKFHYGDSIHQTIKSRLKGLQE